MPSPTFENTSSVKGTINNYLTDLPLSELVALRNTLIKKEVAFLSGTDLISIYKLEDIRKWAKANQFKVVKQEKYEQKGFTYSLNGKSFKFKDSLFMSEFEAMLEAFEVYVVDDNTL